MSCLSGFVASQLSEPYLQSQYDQVRPTLYRVNNISHDNPLYSYLAPVVYQQAIGLSRQLSLILGGATAITFLAGSVIPIWVSNHLRVSTIDFTH